ncbi:MAG: hypothetical protein KDB61_00535 [Planctomycetes bacterium]|nr:hypothetical protein [Planctomycetota bacterium]
MNSPQTPEWNGQSKVPWLGCALLSLALHPLAGTRWLPSLLIRAMGLEHWVEVARWHPIPWFLAVWMALAALAPWKTLRLNLSAGTPGP